MIYSVNKSDVAKIIYRNGAEDVFAPEVKAKQWNDYQSTPDRNVYNSSQGTNSTTEFQPGYKGIIDFGYYFGMGTISMNRLNLNIINGYQVNPNLFLGLGLGAHKYFYNGDNGTLIPIFADFRANFTNRAVSPYFSFDIGYSFDPTDSFHGIGLMLNPTVGVSFNTSKQNAIHVGLGYQMQSISYSFISVNISAIGIKFGVSF